MLQNRNYQLDEGKAFSWEVNVAVMDVVPIWVCHTSEAFAWSAVHSLIMIQSCRAHGIRKNPRETKRENYRISNNLFLFCPNQVQEACMYGMATQMLSKKKCKYVSQWDDSFHKSGTLFNNNHPPHPWWQGIQCVKFKSAGPISDEAEAIDFL